MGLSQTYANLGVVDHNPDRDPLSYWRVHFYDGMKNDPVEMLFDEEPEHRAIEELMLLTDSVSVAIEPPMAEPPASTEEAAERLLAVARGMKSINDPNGLAALVTAAAAYQSLHRTEEGLVPSPDVAAVGDDEIEGSDR
jgi:hypothetical protein